MWSAWPAFEKAGIARLDGDAAAYSRVPGRREVFIGSVSPRMISISVHADDLVSHAGLVTLLSSQPAIEIRSPPPGGPGDARPDVAVVLFESGKSDEVGRLRKLAVDMDRRVVLVVHRLDDPTLENIVDAGVHSIVWREDISAENLVGVVRIVAAGGGDVPPDLVPRLADQARSARRWTDAAHQGGAGLTERETEVLKLLADGWDTREVAERIAYSERTVKGLLHDLMTRRRFRNRTHAVAVALREGLI